MLFKDKKIKVEIGHSVTVSDKNGRHQELPCKFIIPLGIAIDLLKQRLDILWDNAEKILQDPKIAGYVGAQDSGPYKLKLWQHSKEPRELEILLAQPPVIEVEGVSIDKIMIGHNGEDDKFEYVITAKMEIPWKDPDQAGEIDTLAGQTMHAHLLKSQTEMELT